MKSLFLSRENVSMFSLYEEDIPKDATPRNDHNSAQN